jgi:hypothetical protein
LIETLAGSLILNEASSVASDSAGGVQHAQIILKTLHNDTIGFVDYNRKEVAKENPLVFER